MQITGFAYRAFYKKLVEILVSRCFEFEERKSIVTKSPEFWELESKVYKKGSLLYKIAYGDEAINDNHRYLYNKQSEYKNDTHIGTVKDLIIISCLRFMGYQEPKNIKNPSFLKDEPVQAAILFQFFAEDIIPDYEQDYLAEFRVFDHATNSIIESAFESKRGKLKAISKKNHGDILFEITPEELWRFQTHRKLAKFVEQYFSLLTEHNFKAAINMWHPEMQDEYWQNQLQEFQRLFWNLKDISLQNLYLVRSEDQTPILRFQISYIQNVVVQYEPAIFGFLGEVCLADTKKALNITNEFLARCERNGFNIFNFGFDSLFDFSLIEQLHVLGAYDRKRLEAVLPHSDVDFRLVRLATCEVEESSSGEFLIKQFRIERLSHCSNQGKPYRLRR